MLTPGGTNNRLSQEQQQKDVASGASDALQGLKGTIKDQAAFAASQEPGRQSALKRLLMLSSPGNTAARAKIFANSAYDSAANSSRQANLANRAAGISDAYSAGQNQAIANDAATASNNYQAMLNSPEFLTKQAQSLLGQYAQAQGMPALNDYSGLASLVYGRPQVMVQPGIGSLIGQVAGDYLSGMSGGGSRKKTSSSGGDDE